MAKMRNREQVLVPRKFNVGSQRSCAPKIHNFTTKSLPPNLKMSNRTQICDANVIRPAVSLPNQYHKTKKWGIEPKSNLHRPPRIFFRKRKADPFSNRPNQSLCNTLLRIPARPNSAFVVAQSFRVGISLRIRHHEKPMQQYNLPYLSLRGAPATKQSPPTTPGFFSKTQSRPIFTDCLSRTILLW